MIFVHILLAIAAIAICGSVIKRVRSESFPRGKEFLRVLIGCCGFAAALGFVLH